MQTFASFCSFLGIRLGHGESEVGHHVKFLGLGGWFPCRRNDYTHRISLPGEKRDSRAAVIRDFLRKGAISHQELEKLIGRLSFSKTLLCGKSARTHLMPLYPKLRWWEYNARLSTSDTAVFSWCGKVIRFYPRLVFRPCAHFCDWMVYTDAATSHPRIFDLRFRGNTEAPRLTSLLSTAVDSSRAYHFRATCLIFGMELRPMAAFLEDEAASLPGCSIWFYMDSNNSLSAMTRGIPIRLLMLPLWPALGNLSSAFAFGHGSLGFHPN